MSGNNWTDGAEVVRKRLSDRQTYGKVLAECKLGRDLRDRKQARILAKNKLVSLQEAKEDGRLGMEFRHALIDYRNDNEVLKRKVMTMREAAQKNAVLEGTGMAWARVNTTCGKFGL